MKTTEHTFQAPWSRLLSLVSFGTTAILLLLALSLALWTPYPMRFVLPPLLLLIPLGALPFLVRGYRISGRTLDIRRLFGETPIDLVGVRDVSANSRALKGALRTCGNGGLFSFTGWYWSKALGAFRMFATDLSKLVVIRFEKKRAIVVSPGDPGAFLSSVEKLCSPLSSPPK